MSDKSKDFSITVHSIYSHDLQEYLQRNNWRFKYKGKTYLVCGFRDARDGDLVIPLLSYRDYDISVATWRDPGLSCHAHSFRLIVRREPSEHGWRKVYSATGDVRIPSQGEVFRLPDGRIAVSCGKEREPAEIVRLGYEEI